MNMQEIRQLMQQFDSGSAVSLEITCGDTHIQLKKAAAFVSSPSASVCVPATEPTPTVSAFPISTAVSDSSEASTGETVKAPLVGVFYQASSPDTPPFVSAGQLVKKGETLCLIEAMKMMNEIPAPFDGRIESILVTNGDVVAFDTPLFVIQKT